jgi:hypothetical protein
METSSVSKRASAAGVIAALVAGLAGAWLAVLTIRPSFASWFIREDSRFFASGLFSVYDLWRAFATPMNSMGQYRPVTRLLWGIPAWLGGFDIFWYHALTAAILVATGALLARLVYLFFGSAFAAVWGGALFAVLPVNEKPLYWISAWHNSAVALFCMGAFVFRVEERRRSRGDWRLKALCLLSFFLALASREVAFGALAVLLVIDRLETGSFWRSWDVLALAAAVFVFVFVLENPLRTAGVKLGPGAFLHPVEMLSLFWDYVYNVFWAVSDNVVADKEGWKAALAAAALALALGGPFFRRPFAIGTLLVVLGAAPFLLLREHTVEYCSVMALGLAFTLAGAVACLARATPSAAWPVIALLCSALSFAVYEGALDSRGFYRSDFVGPSGALRDFVRQLGEFARTQPPYRPILLEKVEMGRELPVTIHFLHPGIDELIPGRVFLYTHETLGINDGTGASDPREASWRTFLKRTAPPLRAEYVNGAFRSAHD